MVCTRPDDSYTFSITSRYQSDPEESQWIAFKNILKYLRRTKDVFLVFRGLKEDLGVSDYADASFQTLKEKIARRNLFLYLLIMPIVEIVQTKGLSKVLQPKTNT